MTWELSLNGEALIKAFEGLWLTVKRDPVGVPTGGWGHTNLGGIEPKIHMGQRETVEFWSQALRNDMASFSARVNFATKDIFMDQGRFDALVSFDFNTGKLLSRSCSIMPKLKRGDVSGALATLLRYSHGTVDGRLVEFRGLVRRRNAEKLLFEGRTAAALKLAGAQVIDPLAHTAWVAHPEHEELTA